MTVYRKFGGHEQSFRYGTRFINKRNRNTAKVRSLVQQLKWHVHWAVGVLQTPTGLATENQLQFPAQELSARSSETRATASLTQTLMDWAIKFAYGTRNQPVLWSLMKRSFGNEEGVLLNYDIKMRRLECGAMLIALSRMGREL